MVKLRLKRFGRRHRPFYRLCAMDQRSARDSRAIEELGRYAPVEPEAEKALKEEARLLKRAACAQAKAARALREEALRASRAAAGR